MPSSPSSPHRHHHLLVIIPTPPLPSSPPRTITSTHAKHHRDNLLEGASGGGVRWVSGKAPGVRLAVYNSRECVWLSGLAVETAREGCRVGFVKPPEKGAFVVGQPPPEEGASGFGLAQERGVRWLLYKTRVRLVLAGSQPRVRFGLIERHGVRRVCGNTTPGALGSGQPPP
ncbi:hypothetical protein Tco_1419843 [Tanacetum coccineum]